MYYVYVYYNRQSDAIGATEGPGYELYSSHETEPGAIAVARSVSNDEASAAYPHEYAVEGGHYEPGGWDNPVFRAGLRLR